MTGLIEFLLARTRERTPGALAECAARRMIIALHSRSHECVVWNRHSDALIPDDRLDSEYPTTATVYVAKGYIHENCPTLRLLALPDAAHPDFDPEWAR